MGMAELAPHATHVQVIIFRHALKRDTTDRTNANDSNLIAEEDMRKIPDLLPTTYYLAMKLAPPARDVPRRGL